MRTGMAVASCIVALATVALSVAAQAQPLPPSAALQAKSPDAAMIAQMAARGPVRILVHYRLPGAAQPPDDETIRANRAMQQAIISDHFGPPDALTGPDRALRRMEVTPAFAINATAAEIEGLARDDRVLDIVLDRVRRPVPGIR